MIIEKNLITQKDYHVSQKSSLLYVGQRGGEGGVASCDLDPMALLCCTANLR